MAQLPLYTLTAVDIRRASDSVSSRAIIAQKLTIPPIKFLTANHNPGGGVLSVDFTMPRIDVLEPAFAIKGIDPSVFDGMGSTDTWTLAGAYRNRQTAEDIPARCVIEGAITEFTPDESDPAEFQGCNYAFKQVTHFELTFDGEELAYIDFWENVMRLKGTDAYATVRDALGI